MTALDPESKAVVPAPQPDVAAIAKQPKNKSIHVSPAVLDAAAKDGDELLQSLRHEPRRA